MMDGVATEGGEKPVGKNGELTEENVEKSPLEEMPEFDEYRRQIEAEEGSPENEVSDAMAEMVDNRDGKVQLVEQAAGNSMAVQAEYSTDKTSETVVGRKPIYSGEKSVIFVVEKADGKKGTLVESDYFDIATKFIGAYDELKTDLGLRNAMSGISTDLAFIDATAGKVFEDGDEKQRNGLLKDYSTLRKRLEDPEASDKEKMIITEYFDQMRGDALKFLEEHYTSELAEEIPEEEAIEDEKKPDEDVAEKIEDNGEVVEAGNGAEQEEVIDEQKLKAVVEQVAEQTGKTTEEVEEALRQIMAEEEEKRRNWRNFRQ